MEQEVVFSGMAIVILIYIIMYAILFVVSIAAYILQSLGMYTIAKRRNISKPIFAWIPVMSIWLLGAIADDYDEKVNGVKKKSRVVLVSLYIALLVVAIISSVFSVIMAFIITASNGSDTIITMTSLLVIVTVILCLVIMVISVIVMVFQYIAYYKLFKSCNPDNAVVFLVLSIVASISLPVLIFVSRKKDDGLLKDDAVVA